MLKKSIHVMAIMTTMPPMMSHPSRVMALAVTTRRWIVRLSAAARRAFLVLVGEEGRLGTLAHGGCTDPGGGAGNAG